MEPTTPPIIVFTDETVANLDHAGLVDAAVRLTSQQHHPVGYSAAQHDGRAESMLRGFKKARVRKRSEERERAAKPPCALGIVTRLTEDECC